MRKDDACTPRVLFKLLTRSDEALLQDFARRCGAAGYLNNSSIENLKFYDSALAALFWGAIDLNKNKVIAISGAHKIAEEVSSSRIAFRSCYLNPGFGLFNNSMSKEWWKSSLIFNYLLPLQVDALLQQKVKKMYITSNVRPLASSVRGKHFDVDSIMLPVLARTGMISLKAEREYFGCLQNFWELDVLKFQRFILDNRKFQRTDVELTVE